MLFALVDANYKFLYVDVGATGRAGDAGVFQDSSLKKALDTNTLRLPAPQNIEGITTKISYHIVGDDAFPLRKDIMKPYPHRNLDKPKRIFNYRLSRARRVVENAFGILANRFRVFLTTIKLDPDKVVDIILATCCLHNLMVEQNKNNYISVQDFEDVEHLHFMNGQWRSDRQLCGLQTNSSRNSTTNAKNQRTELTNYFSSASGSVPWQEYMCGLK